MVYSINVAMAPNPLSFVEGGMVEVKKDEVYGGAM